MGDQAPTTIQQFAVECLLYWRRPWPFLLWRTCPRMLLPAYVWGGLPEQTCTCAVGHGNCVAFSMSLCWSLRKTSPPGDLKNIYFIKQNLITHKTCPRMGNIRMLGFRPCPSLTTPSQTWLPAPVPEIFWAQTSIAEFGTFVSGLNQLDCSLKNQRHMQKL